MITRKIKLVEIIPTLAVGGAENVTKSICKYINKSHYQLELISLYNCRNLGWPKDTKITSLGKKPGFDFKIIFKLRKELIKIQPDIVHCHHISSLMYLILAKPGLKINLIQTIHNDLTKHKNGYLWILILKVFSVATINISKSLNTALQSRKRNFNIMNGIDCTKIKSARKNRKLILNVGRLEKQKNHPKLLDVFYHITKRDKDFRLIIIGQGTAEKEMRRKIKALRLSNSVELISRYVSTTSYYPQAGFYVSTSNWEGMPLAILEALAHGLIVFSTPVGATEDLIKNNINGFLINNSQPQDIADYFIEKTTTANLAKISKNAATMAKLFTAKDMVDSYAEVFEKIFRSNRRQ